jgi:hypothetical protein
MSFVLSPLPPEIDLETKAILKKTAKYSGALLESAYCRKKKIG